jgi:alpha-tubulin suppressor-like RCC1 family protein
LTSGVAKIAVGTSHTCALSSAGTAQCWGRNNYGQLGDGTTADHITPAPVTGLASGVADLDSGDSHTCAVTDAGSVLCWGSNSNGQLGNGGGGDQLVPETVDGSPTNGALVDAGWYHACAMTVNGGIKCWGENGSGQIGDGSYTDRMSPKTVSGFGANSSLVPGRTAFSSDSLTTGVHTMTAAYEGDTDNVASTSAAYTHTVNKGETVVEKIKFKPKKPKAGKTVKITATIEAVDPAVGIPDGKAVIKDGKKKLGKFKVKKGKAKIKLRDLKSGKHKIKVKYKGADDWEKSDDKKTLKVKNGR